jgi:hypothetical protein
MSMAESSTPIFDKSEGGKEEFEMVTKSMIEQSFSS